MITLTSLMTRTLFRVYILTKKMYPMRRGMKPHLTRTSLRCTWILGELAQHRPSLSQTRRYRWKESRILEALVHRSQPCGYLPITEYPDTRPQIPPKRRARPTPSISQPNTEVSMERESDSINSRPQSQPCGYLRITEYPDSRPPIPPKSIRRVRV